MSTAYCIGSALLSSTERPDHSCNLPCASLRAIDPERFAIVDESLGGALLEEIEESKAFFEVYDGAVYLYQASARMLAKRRSIRERSRAMVRRVSRMQPCARFGHQCPDDHSIDMIETLTCCSFFHMCRAAPICARSSTWIPGSRWCAPQVGRLLTSPGAS